MRKTLTTLVASILFLSLQAQELTQVVRGQVIDQDSRTTLVGATIIIVGSDPIVGTVTDIDGKFRLEDVPVGRISLNVSLMGYESQMRPNILVQAGKETVLEFGLLEDVLSLEAVTVSATEDKKDGEAINEMALVSARAFSVEETKRYAGAFNDPARMVSAYAGVTSNPEGNNDIVVRGNSPRGIQWRMEGIEIPNPNHFADEGASGGGISVLNSNMLANSDFLTGAFPPEYGNAYSGVFDIKLRQGNNEKREYAFGIGALGIDATMEGPFSAKSDASYLVNYRYSSLALLDQAGIVDFDGVPKYTDGSFKVQLPKSKAGTFTLFGLGGRSSILERSEYNEEYRVETGDYTAWMGVAGMTHVLPMGKKTYLRNNLSAATNGSGYNADLEIYNPFGGESFEEAIRGRPDTVLEGERDRLDKRTYRVSSILNHKINAKHKLQAGLIFNYNNFSFKVEDVDYSTGEREVDVDSKGDATLARAFVSWKYRITPGLTMVSGFQSMKFSLSDEYAVEPRVGLQWNFAPDQWLNAGAGMVSKHESLTSYYAQNELGQELNQDLGLLKARHYVLGYKRQLGLNLYGKVEAYYQDLYNIPVENDPGSFYSVLNQDDWFTGRDLVNEGRGKNYGIEFTLERYFANNFYFLFSGSLYEAKFKTLSNTWYDTKYNGNYATNFLIGKDFNFGRADRKRVLSINGKFFYSGPRRFTPIDREQLAQGVYALDESNPFGGKGDPIFQINYSMSLRTDRGKSTREVAIDILNLTNNQARLREFASDGTVQYDTQLSLIPNLIYRVYF